MSLGHCVVNADPPKEDKQMLLKNVRPHLFNVETTPICIVRQIWKVVSKLTVAAEYIACIQVWIEYATKNFTVCLYKCIT